MIFCSVIDLLLVESREVGAQMGDRIGAGKKCSYSYLPPQNEGRLPCIINYYSYRALTVLYDPSFRFSLFIIS